MKTVVFLRIAAVLTLIHAVLHTVGGVFGKPAPGVATVIAASMRTRFPVFGVMRSYADFYLGLGLGISIFLTVEGIAFWIMASIAKSGDARRLRPLIAVFVITYLAMAANSFLFFFAGPVVVEILIAACLVAAIFTAGSTEEDVTLTRQPELKSVSQ